MSPVFYAIEFTIKSSIILLFCSLINLILGKKSASTRHLIWVLGFSCVLFLPLARFLTPAIPVNLSPAKSRDQYSFASSSGPTATSVLYSAPSQIDLVQAPRHGDSFPGSISSVRNETRLRPVGPVNHFETAPFEATSFLIGTWILGVAVLTLYTAMGRMFAIRLAHRSRPTLPTGLPQFNSASNAQVLVAPGMAVPITFGLFRPKIILPFSSERWPTEVRESVLLHELAHIRRFDTLWQSLAQLLCTLHWFNPLVWLAAKKLRFEAEAAADDFVLQNGRPASAYASDLIILGTQIAHLSHSFPTAGVAFMKHSELEKRVAAILDAGRARSGRIGWTKMLGLTLVSVAAIAAIAGIRSGVTVKHDYRGRFVSQDSQIWKVSIKEDESATTVFVYHDGDRLVGYEVSVKRGGQSSGSCGGSLGDLSSWTLDRPRVTLSNGTQLQPFRLIDPDYRRLCATSGLDVIPSTLEELKKVTKLSVPPDAERERKEFLEAHSAQGVELTGPSIFFDGNLIGVISQSAIFDTTHNQRHWWITPDSDNPKDGNSGYWRYDSTTVGMPMTDIFHLVGNTVYWTQLTAYPEMAQPVNGKAPAQRIAYWRLVFDTNTWVGGGSVGINHGSIQPQYLNDPEYRRRLAAKGIQVHSISEREAQQNGSVVYGPELETRLAAATKDFSDELNRQDEQMRNRGDINSVGRTVVRNTRVISQIPPANRGSLTMDGKITQVLSQPLIANYGTRPAPKPFDVVAELNTLVSLDQQLDSLAKEWAKASVAVDDAKASGGGGKLYDAEDEMASVRSRVEQLVFNYPGPNASSSAGDAKSFYQQRLSELQEHRALLKEKADEADRLFAQGKMSEYDKELAEDYENIAMRKILSLHWKLPISDFRSQEQGPSSSTEGRSISTPEFEHRAISIE